MIENPETTNAEVLNRDEQKKGYSFKKPLATGAIGAGLLALGLVVGAGAMVFAAPRDTALLMQPTAISALASDNVIAVKGKVVEVFGNKFIIQDTSGRALVETGRRGEGGTLVDNGETLTVQGRFDNGFIRGEILVHQDGRAESLKPPRPGARGLVDRLKGPGIETMAPGEPG